MSWAEAKWVHDQLLQATGQTPANMRMFTSEVISKSSVGLRFLEPTDSYVDGNLTCAIGGVMIRMGENGYPINASDGTLVVDNTDLGKYKDEPFVVEGLETNKTYYFAAFPYSATGVYKVTDNGANRVIGIPKDGETVNVRIIIDDSSAFGSVTVTCVNETNPEATQTATLTPGLTTASFVVPIGNVYHVEFGSVNRYSKPDDTPSTTAVAGKVSDYEGEYRYFTATIDVTYPEGATLTCTLGGTVHTATTSTGTYQFVVHDVGTWTIKAVSGAETDSKQVTITSDGQRVSVALAFVQIYGISRDITSSSPDWARTESAVNMTATASVGATAGSSDFDNAMPWAGITRETLSTGDVMVKIPKFYYKRYRDGNIEHIKIADRAAEGFALHPAFNHSGVEKDYVYVGAYKTTSKTASLPNKGASAGLPRGDARKAIMEKGDGWGLIDISTTSAVQMLILVEFATNDVQTAIGKGYCDSNISALSTGSCNTVPNLTGRTSATNGKSGVVYRGIEDFWSNIFEWVDGLNVSNTKYYVCNDPSSYADSTATGYTALSYARPGQSMNAQYITQMGFDSANPHVMLPTAASGGSSTTYYCDSVWLGTASWQVAQRGGNWNYGLHNGLFTMFMQTQPAYAGTDYGWRMQYIPS